MVHSELNEGLVRIRFEKWCTTIHYFAFLYMNDVRNKLNFCLLMVHGSLEIYHTAVYTLKYSIGTTYHRVREYYGKLVQGKEGNNEGKCDGMTLPMNKTDKHTRNMTANFT